MIPAGFTLRSELLSWLHRAALELSAFGMYGRLHACFICPPTRFRPILVHGRHLLNELGKIVGNPSLRRVGRVPHQCGHQLGVGMQLMWVPCMSRASHLARAPGVRAPPSACPLAGRLPSGRHGRTLAVFRLLLASAISDTELIQLVCVRGRGTRGTKRRQL